MSLELRLTELEKRFLEPLRKGKVFCVGEIAVGELLLPGELIKAMDSLRRDSLIVTRTSSRCPPGDQVIVLSPGAMEILFQRAQYFSRPF